MRWPSVPRPLSQCCNSINLSDSIAYLCTFNIHIKPTQREHSLSLYLLMPSWEIPCLQHWSDESAHGEIMPHHIATAVYSATPEYAPVSMIKCTSNYVREILNLQCLIQVHCVTPGGIKQRPHRRFSSVSTSIPSPFSPLLS
jgi:hypothetical protein